MYAATHLKWHFLRWDTNRVSVLQAIDVKYWFHFNIFQQVNIPIYCWFNSHSCWWEFFWACRLIPILSGFIHMGGSINGGTPQSSSIFIGFSLINHPFFWCSSMTMEPPKSGGLWHWFTHIEPLYPIFVGALSPVNPMILPLFVGTSIPWFHGFIMIYHYPQ